MLQTIDTSSDKTTVGPTAIRSPNWLRRLGMALQRHYPEYLMEAAGLGLFMISACAFSILIYAPQSPVAATISIDLFRRCLMGAAMGISAIALIYSPWGQQSGAHLNPAVTWTFYRLKKVTVEDALFYTLFQLAGGVLGVLLMALLAPTLVSQPEVNYAVTVPGRSGIVVAWAAEFVISAALMMVVLMMSNTRRWASATGLAAGAVVAINIVIAQPLSGMSMNPARTMASAIASSIWTAWWIYITAPPLAMWSASLLYEFLRGKKAVFCAKLHHPNRFRCIFCGDGPSKRVFPKARVN